MASRTILDIAVEAAERDATAPAPQALFGTNDRIAKIMRGAAKDTIRELMRQTRWMGLSEWHSTWVFTLRPGRFAYPLPPDFLRIIPYTEQRNGWPLGFVGPATPQNWAWWVFGGGGAGASPMGWRIRNDAIFIEPMPQAEELIAIEYISRYPVVSEIRVGDYDLSTEPLQTVAPIVARDGWLSAPNADAILQPGPNDGAYDTPDGFDEQVWPQEPTEILRRINPMSTAAPLPQVRRPEFTADTDLPAFGDDYLLSIGMTFRLRRALGLPYAEHAAEYENEMAIKLAEDAGGARSIYLGREMPTAEAIPLGNGNWLVS